jgi:hypothetical protein
MKGRTSTLFFYARQTGTGSPLHGERLLDLTREVFKGPFIIDRTDPNRPRGVMVLVEEWHDPVLLGSNCWAAYSKTLSIPLHMWGHILQRIEQGVPRKMPAFVIDPDSSDTAVILRFKIDRTKNPWKLVGYKLTIDEEPRIWPEDELCILGIRARGSRGTMYLPGSFIDQAKGRIRACWR